MPSRKTAPASQNPNGSSFEDVTREDLEEIEHLMMEELDNLQFRTSHALSSAAVATANFAELVQPYYEQGRAFVRQHPVTTIGGALALGVVLGGLLGRS